MRIHILSDLHTEFHEFEYRLPSAGADVLVLAGDIGVGEQGIEWIERVCPRSLPVVYVLGNHEYWGQDIGEFVRELRARAAQMRSNVFILERDVVEIDGVAFLGATLWTDFELFGIRERSLDIASARFTDFMVIRSGLGTFSSREAERIHSQSVRWLEAACADQGDKKKVIITHHPPVTVALPEYFKHEELSPSFVSAREDLVVQTGATLWVCGHTHKRLDTFVGSTRVVSNPAGYPPFSIVKGFDRSLVVEV